MFKELAKRLGFLPPQGARPQADQPVEAPAPRDAGTVLHIGHSGTFLGTPAGYLASPFGRRFQEAAE